MLEENGNFCLFLYFRRNFHQGFYLKGCWTLLKAFSALIQVIMWVLFPNLFVWWIILNNLPMLKQTCIPRMNSHWWSSQDILEDNLTEFEDVCVYVHQGNQTIVFYASPPLYLVLELKQYWFLRMSLGSVFCSIKLLAEHLLALLYRVDRMQGSIRSWAFLFYTILYYWLYLLIFMDLFKLLVVSEFNFGRSCVSRNLQISSSFSPLLL